MGIVNDGYVEHIDNMEVTYHAKQNVVLKDQRKDIKKPFSYSIMESNNRSLKILVKRHQVQRHGTF